jgi:hypothetical protein
MSARTEKSRIELEVAAAEVAALELAGLESGERFAGGERSEPGGRAQRPVGETLRAAAGGPRARRSRELAPEPVDEAIDRSRLRAAVELPVGGRLPDEAIDALLGGARSEEEIVGLGGLLARLTKRLVERAMEADLTDHLGFEAHQEPPMRATLPVAGGPTAVRRSADARAADDAHGRCEAAARAHPATRRRARQASHRRAEREHRPAGRHRSLAGHTRRRLVRRHRASRQQRRSHTPA